MATLLHRLGKTAYRRWPFFIAGWLVLLIAVVAVAAGFSKPMSDAFTIPGIPSEKAADLQSELFPGAADALDEASVTVVVAAPEGHTLDEPTYAEGRRRAGRRPGRPAADADGRARSPTRSRPPRRRRSRSSTPPSRAARRRREAQANADALSPLSEDGRVGTISFTFDVDTVADVEPATIDALDRRHGPGPRRRPDRRGQRLRLADPGDRRRRLRAHRHRRSPLIVLLLTFGSFVAAGLPILTAVFGLGVGLTGITALTAFMDVSSSTTILATMIGLAVGIDYTLFILARYRTRAAPHRRPRGSGRHRRRYGGLGRRLRRPHRADRARPRSPSSASRSSPPWASRPRRRC